MNTIRSTWIGWGTLIIGELIDLIFWEHSLIGLAGGGAYYFAKRSVNADRAARHEEDMRRRHIKANIEAEYNAKPLQQKSPAHRARDNAGSPSTEASHDPAPTDHNINNGSQNGAVADKYLANKPYRAKKGDRFS